MHILTNDVENITKSFRYSFRHICYTFNRKVIIQIGLKGIKKTIRFINPNMNIKAMGENKKNNKKINKRKK